MIAELFSHGVDQTVLLTVLIFIVAVLYSSVGHAGATAYLAVMALVGVAPEVMKPSALILNIFVATIGTVRFYRAGCFSWQLFLPLAIGSVPFAFIGGAWSLPGSLYNKIVGAILLMAAARLFLPQRATDEASVGPPPRKVWLLLAPVCGALIGFLAGLTGTGGGVFLTPLLLIAGWADPRRAAGVSVVFILVNSIAGLAGHLFRFDSLPAPLAYWLIAAILGGTIGSGLGSKRLGNTTIRRLLSVVILIAGLKLLLT